MFSSTPRLPAAFPWARQAGGHEILAEISARDFYPCDRAAMAIARMRAINDDLYLALGQSPRGEGFCALGQIGFEWATAMDFGRVDILQANGFVTAFDRVAVDGNTSDRGGGEM